MKKTRNLFVLTGSEQGVQTALEHIQFKGVAVLSLDDLSKQRISEVFANNKSAVCTHYTPGACSPILPEILVQVRLKIQLCTHTLIWLPVL